MVVQDDIDASSLFRGLLVPSPTAEDVNDIVEKSESRVSRFFVTNCDAACNVYAHLEPLKFMNLSESLQTRVLTLMDIGLGAGSSSVLRLRIGCERGPDLPSVMSFDGDSRLERPTLARKLLELLKTLSDKNAIGGSGQDILRMIGRIIGMVCSSGIQVDELKWILREIRAPSAATQPLLTALSIMVPNRISSSDSIFTDSGCRADFEIPSLFNFDGIGSGLVLPEMQWPFTQEYQIILWLKIDDRASATSGKSLGSRAHLITLLTGLGAGVDYYLEGTHLFATVADGKGAGQLQQKVVDLGDVGFVAGQWHALMICHRRSSALLFNKDQLEVFVDGRLVFSSLVPFPRNVTETLSRFSIGWDFDGQTSGVFVLSRALDSRLVASILGRLAGQTGGLDEHAAVPSGPPADPDFWIDPATVSAKQSFRRKLLGSKSLLLTALLPSRTVDGLCLDPHSGHHAQLRGHQTHAWMTRTASDVLRSIGGTKTLLPLACYLLSDFDSPPTAGPALVVMHGGNVDTMLSVLLSFLRGNPANQHDFFSVGGMEILEMLLLSAPPTCFSLAGAHTVIVLEAIYLACGLHHTLILNTRSVPAASETAHQLDAKPLSLQCQVVVFLLANFPLWARAPPALQFGLATILLDLVRENPTRFRSMVSVESVLTSVRTCCSDGKSTEGDHMGRNVENSSDRLEVPKPLPGDSTRALESSCVGEMNVAARGWTQMARRERRHMRNCLWNVIRLLLEKTTSPDDGTALVRFMASCDDARLVSELVQMLGSLIRQPDPPPGLFQVLEDASKGCPPVEFDGRGTPTPAASISLQPAFVHLALHRCVMKDGSSEESRVAGLRAASVFMARFEYQTEAQVPADVISMKERWRVRDPEVGVRNASSDKLGDSMGAKVSSAFPLLSEALMRDRHLLGEPTYVALLEMALLADEREVCWSEQGDIVNVVTVENCRRERRIHRKDAVPEKAEVWTDDEQSEKLGPSACWSRDEARDERNMKEGLVLDDTQRIRNMLPLALILQHLPTMAGSVQVRSHGDLLLMLKLNAANRQKVVEMSHAHGDRFWGMWERCLFLMMAPLFARRVDGVHKGVNEQGLASDDSTREGYYYMVLKLYAILLEHMVCSDEQGHKEIDLVTSLQPLIPHGRVAARVLLAQVAYELGQHAQRFRPVSQSAASASAGTAADTSDEQPHATFQPCLKNMVHLAFVAASLVSEDVSTVTAGLFPEGEDLAKRVDTVRSGGESRHSSAAAASVPVLLCSSPATHGSLALSMRVLSMFGVLLRGSRASVGELCSFRSLISNQGPLLFPLVRLSLFLLVRLHPCTKPAEDNLSRLESLVRCLVDNDWEGNFGDECLGCEHMCVVVLAHVHAALLRLKAITRTSSHASEGSAPGSSAEFPALSTAAVGTAGRVLLDLLELVTTKRYELLSSRLGERLTTNLVDAVSHTLHGQSNSLESRDQLLLHRGGMGDGVEWMESSPLFVSTPGIPSGRRRSMPAFLEACMPSLKAAEELESKAVRAAGERTQRWQELGSHATRALPSADGEGELGSITERGRAVLHAVEQQAVKAQALLMVKTKRRLLAARQRLQRCVHALCAAWSPWARGSHRPRDYQPEGWELSSHKDQLMRQMLLVPLDKDVRHEDASYDGSTASASQSSRPRVAGDSARQSEPPSGVLPLKPSASLLAGEIGFLDDDEEETDVQDDAKSTASRSLTFENNAPAEREASENVAGSAGVHNEIKAEGRTVVGEQSREDAHSSLYPANPTEHAFQPTRGSWTTTMLFRECSILGTLYLFADTLVFESEPDSHAVGNETFLSTANQYRGQAWHWRLERLTQLHLRRFLLSPQAVELFWADSPEVFLAFQDVAQRQTFTRTLRMQNLPMLPMTTRHGTLHPRKVLKASRLTELWRRRQISNFQYIMELNVIAGRSYNDVTQYPVFPWVLSDYTSTKLDLDNPKCFRDLSKPVGALNEERRIAFKERYATFEDPLTPKFMYGSHYSSAGVVLHYLVRQEPFTTLHIKLQDGRFDCPDRLFYDISQCWNGCIDVNSMSDVKELTPEFFYCPEIFLNSNKLSLGKPQAGGVVDDVLLPPWAKDAYDFVRMHRLALESEQVSQHLHEWIDLIFGYKQRGHEAVKAANVYYYLTYEGAVDLSQVNDSRQKEAMEAQIRHFGQTPSQLLLEPHPVRLPPEECVLPLFSSTSTLQSLRVYSPRNWPRERDGSAALLVYCTEDRLVCVDASLRATTWAWSGLPNGRGQPFTLGACKVSPLPSSSLHMSKVGSTRPALVARMCLGSTSPPGPQDIPPASAPEVGMISRMGSNLLSRLSGSLGPNTSPRESVTTTENSGIAYEAISNIPPRSIGRVHSCFGVCTAVGPSSDSILSCGYWDHAVRRHSIDSSTKMVMKDSGTGGHEGAVNCLSITDGGSLMVTGGQDCTCRVWVVANTPMALALRGEDDTQAVGGESSGGMMCVHVLYGHEQPIVSLAVSEELDATVSGASDGRIILHCLKDGRYVRQFFCTGNVPMKAGRCSPEASQLAFSCHGDVVVHSCTDLSLHRFSLNGAHLATGVAPTEMSCLLTAGGGEYLLGGGEDGLIRVYRLHDLCIVHAIDLREHGGLTCMRMSANHEYLLAGSEDGEVSIITDAKTRLRMLDLALQKAFIG